MLAVTKQMVAAHSLKNHDLEKHLLYYAGHTKHSWGKGQLSQTSFSHWLNTGSQWPVSKKPLILALVKMVKKTLFRTIAIDVKTISIEERDCAQLWIQQRQMGTCSQCTAWGRTVNGKLLKGDIKGREILAEADQMIRCHGWRMRNLIR